MNKHYLLRKTSVVHVIKCGKTTLFDKAIESYDRLAELKELLVKSQDNELEYIAKQIDEWAGSNPMVHESEISQFMRP